MRLVGEVCVCVLLFISHQLGEKFCERLKEKVGCFLKNLTEVKCVLLQEKCNCPFVVELFNNGLGCIFCYVFQIFQS
jgi:hypothetical protein